MGHLDRANDHDLAMALRLAADAGEMMLKAGAEINRVEETIDHFARAYGVCRVDAYATPTGLFVTGEDRGQGTHTLVRRVVSTGNDLAMVAAVNDLSRRASQGLVSIEEAKAELAYLAAKPAPYSRCVTCLAAALASAAASVLVGGAFLDAIAAGIAGLLVRLAVLVSDTYGGGAFTRSWVGGLVAAAAASGIHSLVPRVSTDLATVGAIMTLVPGVAITNALREIMGGQLVSGVARSIEALAIATGVAAGVALGLGSGM